MSTFEVFFFAVCCFFIALVGGLAGLVLGNIRLPILLLFAVSPAAGAAANIAISTASAATSAVAHLRGARVNWQLFVWMAPPSIVGALIGGYLSGFVAPTILLLVVALIVFIGGVDLLRWKPAANREQRQGRNRFEATAAVLSGLGTGLLGGLVGLLLGSLRMPALIRLVGVQPAKAVGTNVAVGFTVGVAGLIGHLPSSPPDWWLVLIGSLASIPGAAIGSHLTGKLPERQLVRTIACIMLITGVAMVVKALW